MPSLFFCFDVGNNFFETGADAHQAAREEPESFVIGEPILVPKKFQDANGSGQAADHSGRGLKENVIMGRLVPAGTGVLPPGEDRGRRCDRRAGSRADVRVDPGLRRGCHFSYRGIPMADERKVIMSRWVRLQDADRSFDIEFWQRLGPDAISKAAWELVELAYEGKNIDLRLQRSVASFRRLRG
jgi:hypothetical protein